MRLRDKIVLLLKILLSNNPNKFLSKKYTKRPKTAIEYIPSVVFDNKLLTGRNVLITGAGQNIGKAIAIEMARQGASIYFTDLDENICSSLESELEDYKGNFKGFVSDISSADDIDILLNKLLDQSINIEILVNNAGLNFDKKGIGINNFNIEEWRKTYETNVFGPMYLTKKISDNMIENNIDGNIIFITSVHQEVIGHRVSYSSSKAALGMIVKELASALAENKIRVNGIAPGWVKCDDYGNPVYCKNYKLHNTSIEPSFIGRAAVYLASEYFSKYTTGAVLKIDSGHSLAILKDLHLL